MQEREQGIVTSLVVLLLVLTLGFYVHRDARFPGSLAGGVLGLSATALMLIPLVYLCVKRIPLLKKDVTRAVSMRSLLAIHMYAGVLGPILGVLHSGHKFNSPLGISLTAMMTVVALSGFIGRYLMRRVSADMRQQQQLLAGLRVAYDRVAAELTQDAGQAATLRPFAGFFRRLTASFFVGQGDAAAQPIPAAVRALRLSESMADLAIGIAVPYLTHERGSAAVPGWQSMVNPGTLSAKHQFLATKCEACHTPHAGITADKCIVCHANNQSLLANQPTAFHATISACRGCHVEHLGVAHRPITTGHVVLARIGAQKAGVDPQSRLAALPVAHPRIQSEEMALDCAACHVNQDPHRTLFGRDCAACHATSTWNIPEFRHPSSLSMDCAQCHQAPPSHYMGHFHMVSMTVAGIEHADVSQCFLCHKTNAWNDIKGAGWYKHH